MSYTNARECVLAILIDMVLCSTIQMGDDVTRGSRISLGNVGHILHEDLQKTEPMPQV